MPDALGSTPPPEDDADEMPGASPWSFWFGLVVVVLSLVSGLATYLILTGLTPIAPRNDVVLIVLAVNIVLIVVMFAVLVVQGVGLWRAWQRKVAGARIHVRIVGLFTIIAALPALLLALAATTTFSRSLDTWFSTRTRTIVASSLDVAQAYLAEHGQVIRTDVVNMAKDLDDVALEGRIGASDVGRLRNVVMAQVALRDLSIAAVIDAKGQPVTQAAADNRVAYTPPDPTVIAQAASGQVPLLMPREQFRVAAISQLQQVPGHFLYVARSVNPTVVGHLQRTQAAVAEYEQLRRARGGPKLAHGIMYFMIALTGMLAAIWVGLWFARHLVAPIRRLIGAAQRVAHGDLDVVLPLRRGEGDLRRLSRDFNNMTSELARQRHELVSANTQLIERRRFMEAVLSGVSAGVIGLGPDGTIRLVNPSAELLLAIHADAVIGRRLADVLPELASAIEEGDAGHKPRGPRDVTLAVAGDERRFSVRITSEQAGSSGEGRVVTFDDITELVVAQRSAAWGDVARRIAHEIKNPLTPIQLSAERLRRKYGASIQTDRDTFEKLTDTIVRQVGDIKTMVDEFAAFARVPKPEIALGDVREAVQEPVILFRESHPGVRYVLQLPSTALMASIDRRLISQALTNLVKNATESVMTAAEAPDRAPDWEPTVQASLRHEGDRIEIEVLDNGLGLPKQNRARLLEPYVTTKGSKGTGLGLAIVQKIVEQHGGTLALEDAPPALGRARGALVRLTLPAGRRVRGEARDQAPGERARGGAEIGTP
ncbi:MAG: PAS domain-containing sensor histidine kinase [Hyphomicrobiaceae bacterium]|nr:PAS domain-containing sensor histidine kinase [Hyphomicrobiaceae bacterium]